MQVLGLILVAGLKTLLCKGFALCLLLVLFWIKGRQLQFRSERWADFFLSFPERKAEYYAIRIYLIAAMFSSVMSYGILEAIGYRHSLEIAIILFVSGVAITAYRWQTKGKDYLRKRYQEIPKTILEEREKNESVS